jgi:Uma2 family endonuclease
MSTSTLITADDLMKMPSNGTKQELVRGELRTMAPAGFEHGDIGLELASRLRQFVKTHQLGKVVGSEVGFVLSRDPDHVRSPDAAFVRASRLPAAPVVKFFPGAPDLAAEIISPHDTAEELQEKINDYLTHGVQLIWIIYPRTRTAQVHRPNQPTQTIPPTGSLTGENLLPGYEVKLADLFT